MNDEYKQISKELKEAKRELEWFKKDLKRSETMIEQELAEIERMQIKLTENVNETEKYKRYIEDCYAMIEIFKGEQKYAQRMLRDLPLEIKRLDNEITMCEAEAWHETLN